LKEAAFVRGGRYGISIDFGLEIIEKKSACVASFNSKLTDPTMEATLGSLYRNARLAILQRALFGTIFGKVGPLIDCGPGLPTTWRLMRWSAAE
jgi:hypothetical protein